MKANFEIRPEMPSNREMFQDPFFDRFAQRPAPGPLQLSPEVQKLYRFPTFYSDVTCALGIFLCDYEKAKRMLPHPKMKPVRMPKGRALVAMSCYEYKNVYQVLPYNEISMMIPVLLNPVIDVPVLPMILSGLFKSMGYWVFSMPVTSKENQIRGNDIWGLPKITQDIDITEENGDCVTVAKEKDGTPYFTLRVPMSGKKTTFDVETNVYSKLDERLLISKTAFKADFLVTKEMGPLFKPGLKPVRPFLTIGNTESTKALRELDIEEHPFQFRYAKHMNAAFDLAHDERSLHT